MDARQEKGRVLAADKRIKRIEGATWFVPSQTGGTAGYVVNMLSRMCSCPDHETRMVKCKHMWAVETVETTQTVDVAADGSATVTETVKVTRKTYSQDWPSYNRAQCEEKGQVEMLLRSLCDGIVTPPQTGRGRPRVPLADAVYAMTMKTYTTVSGRRAMTDIDECATKGHMAKAPRYNTTFDYFAKPEMAPLLTALVEESARPLAAIESTFAADSTGFSTSVYRRWYDAKYGREMKEHAWIKAHAMVGTVTNVVTAITVTEAAGEDSHDARQFPHLVASTADNFAMKEVSADKAYLTRRNLQAVEGVGAVPYVPFKSNSKGAGPAAWRRMWGMFMYRQDEFLAAYHRRSNVEATFYAIKRKFGGSVRSKLFDAQVNEVLCKALCFNLSVLVHAMRELNVAPEFRGTELVTS
jgi:transposase